MVAHSPDADDIFMYYAIYFGWIGGMDRENQNRLIFENIALDIETLNIEALKSSYDVSAISFALYPHIKDEYALLRTGVSFGEGYGPKLVKRKGVALKRNFKVALSGEHTTNAMLFRLEYPESKIVYKNFLEIEEAVLNGEVDGGVLIHESILNFSEKLEVEREIWDIWTQRVGEIPLPLGGMAIKRSIPLNRAIECEDVLTKAVEVAVKNRKVLSKMLLERRLIRVNESELEKYLSLYANENSMSLSDLQIESIEKLYKLGYDGGFYSDRLNLKDYMLPREYSELRFGRF